MRVMSVVSFLLATVTFVCAQEPTGHHDVNLDFPKLIDFKTHFHADPAAIMGSGAMDSASWFNDMIKMQLVLDGTLALNVLKGELDMSMHFTDVNNDAFNVRITFDASNGNAAISANAHVNTEPAAGTVAETCTKITVPSSMLAKLPSPASIQQEIDASSGQANFMINNEPHAKLSYKGQKLIVYIACLAGCADDHGTSIFGDHGDSGITIFPDGTPFGIFPSVGNVKSPEQLVNKINEESVPLMKFEKWTSPGPSFEGQMCNPGLDTKELMEQPRVRMALLMAEGIIKNVERTAPIRLFSSGVFTQVPQLFLDAGGIPAVERAASTQKPVAGGFGLIFVAAVAFSSAAVGAFASRWAHGRSYLENGYGQLLA